MADKVIERDGRQRLKAHAGHGNRADGAFFFDKVKAMVIGAGLMPSRVFLVGRPRLKEK